MKEKLIGNPPITSRALKPAMGPGFLLVFLVGVFSKWLRSWAASIWCKCGLRKVPDVAVALPRSSLCLHEGLSFLLLSLYYDA